VTDRWTVHGGHTARHARLDDSSRFEVAGAKGTTTRASRQWEASQHACRGDGVCSAWRRDARQIAGDLAAL
jgi:hypothetical protein